MKKAGKERAKTLTPEDYAELIRKTDMMLGAFQSAKSEIGSEWRWWSLSIYARENSDKTWEKADTIWSDFNKEVIHQKSFPLGGMSDFENDNEFTAYFATSEGGTESEFYRIVGVAESTVKALLIFYPPKCGFGLSHYLDGFVKAKSYYSNTGTSPSVRYARWCWFEFLYNMASEIGSPVRITWQEIPIVDDFPPNYFELMRKPHAGRLEPRLHPEVRRIEHDICEASILALKFLRNAAKSKRDRLQQSTKTESEKALQNEASKVNGDKKEQPWDANNPDYLPLSQALVRLADSKIALSTVSNQIKPDGIVRYMRKGQRCRVHIGDFNNLLRNKYPQLTIKSEILDEYTEEILADRTAMQTEIRKKK